MNSITESDLDSFLETIDWDSLLHKFKSHFNYSIHDTRKLILSLRAESKFGFQIIKDHIDFDKRVLEVGSGIGLLAAFLNTKGIEITALEPGLGGFGINSILANELSAYSQFSSLKKLNHSAEDLSPKLHGEFDLIYSINVLEHIPRLQESIRKIAGVLSSKGKVVSTCPNYTIPYEPHFGIPLIPFCEKLTPIFIPKCRNSELWNSLNFITARKVKEIAKILTLEVRFECHTLHRSLLRLEKDPEFFKRHSNIFVKLTYRLLKISKFLEATRYLPPEFSTPMVFELVKPE